MQKQRNPVKKEKKPNTAKFSSVWDKAKKEPAKTEAKSDFTEGYKNG